MANFNKLLSRKKDKLLTGFTLIEAVVVTFIVIVGIIGVLTVSQHAVLIVYDARDKLTAVYLAKEGAEIVRNIRDRNFLRGYPWKTGLDSGVFMAAFDNPELITPYLSIPLLINANGFYNYTTGTSTKFKRKINLTHLTDPDRIRSEIKVYWTDRGRTYNVTLEENLYNWR